MRFYQLSNREKLLLCILVVFMLAYVFYTVILSPQVKAYNKTVNEVNSVKNEIESSIEFINSHKQEQEQLEKTKTQLNALKTCFSGDVSDGAALAALGAAAEKEGVTITFFQPYPVLEKEYFFEFPFDFSVRGTYQAVLSYLGRLEDNEHLVNFTEIRALVIEPWPKEGEQSGQSGDVTAMIKIVIFADNLFEGNTNYQKPAEQVVGRQNGFLKPEMLSLPSEVGQNLQGAGDPLSPVLGITK